MILAHLLAALGLILLTILPEVMSDPFVGLFLAVLVYAAGGGLLEVLVSPVVEACPTDNKEKAMSLLHSFYCWGHVGVVLVSTLFFTVFGISNWKILAVIWAIVPLCNAAVFTRVPMASLLEEEEKGMSMKELFSMKIFWVLMLMMLCAGASEQAVSQWASALAEKGFGFSKTVGDLAGPLSFAALMGCSRAFYGKFGDKINLERFMQWSAALCIVSYLMIAFIPIPALGFLGCALCGLSVGIMWPGTISNTSGTIPMGGTAMFALLAMAGDLGGSIGPYGVGLVTQSAGDNRKSGMLAGAVFPVILVAAILLLRRMKRRG